MQGSHGSTTTLRRGRALVSLGVAAAIAACVPAQAEASRSACFQVAHRGHLLKESTRAIVFTRGDHVLGCYYRGTRIRRLPNQGSAVRDGEPGRNFVQQRPLALEGRYVAYMTGFASRAISGRFLAEATGRVIVLDLSTGRVKAASADTNTETSLGSIVLKRNGSVAWIQSETGFASTTTVRKMDQTAAGEQQLDFYNPASARPGDAAIAFGSLALSSDRTRIYWSTDAGPRTAELR